MFYILFAGLEVFGNLCHVGSNIKHMLIDISDELFVISVNLLLLPDVELTLASLEMLYRLSQIDEEMCTRIVLVTGSIG